LKKARVKRKGLGGCWYAVLLPTKLNEALRIFTTVPFTSLHNKVGGEEKDRGDFRLFRIFEFE
jgi:hypothetical protein